MPSIADQVATMEHDHAAALVLIDQLNAANAALTAANHALQRDCVALSLEINDMKHYVDDTRTMAEQLAGAAHDMLRASRRQVGTPAEVIPFAPKATPEERKAMTKAAIGAIIDADPRFREGDSGDEHRDALEYCHGPIDCTLAGTCTACHDAKMPDISLVEAQRATPLPPHAGPMLVRHEGDLPIFLQRDTPHGASRAIFG